MINSYLLDHQSVRSILSGWVTALALWCSVVIDSIAEAEEVGHIGIIGDSLANLLRSTLRSIDRVCCCLLRLRIVDDHRHDAETTEESTKLLVDVVGDILDGDVEDELDDHVEEARGVGAHKIPGVVL